MIRLAFPFSDFNFLPFSFHGTILKDVQCITVPEDIDETEFIVHPVVDFGLKLGSLKGTPDYEMGKGMVTAFLDAVDCDDIGSLGMATYQWLSEIDYTTPVSFICLCCTSLAFDRILH